MLDFIAQLFDHVFSLLGQAGSRHAWPILLGSLILISLACALLLWASGD
jgi:hypothetical protein